ncbi:hypothetical protein [Pseudomonas synxantha]|uniref:hypothetical protein n=1 Tax=Pseudomonas synxantha TaxID=47883 RepID=UPI000A9A573A|nr:hypothetical protein [Pseudomonas synxantha]
MFKCLASVTRKLRGKLARPEEWDDEWLESGISLENDLTIGPIDGRTHSMQDLRSAYRYDFRSPVEIMSVGFQGTPSTYHLFARHGNSTIFSGATLKGADFYKGKIDQLQKKKQDRRQLSLYKINLTGLEFYDFKREYSLRGEASMLNAYKMKIKSNPKWYKKNIKALKSQGYKRTEANNLIFNQMFRNGMDIFLKANELHIKGPIVPNSITPILPHTHPKLEYLDLAVSPTVTGTYNTTFQNRIGYDAIK